MKTRFKRTSHCYSSRIHAKTALKQKLLTGLMCIGLLSGCENINSQLATVAALETIQAATLTDEDIKSVSRQAAAKMDAENKVAPSDSPYAQRLARLVRNYHHHDGLELNFKVYLSPQVNAFAMADGTVRVYSGLMDQLNDDELLFVIGHEIGHVRHEHSKKQAQLALSTSAIRKGTASVGGTIGTIAQSDLGTLSEKIIHAQFSQKEEKEADDYGLKFLKQGGYPVKSAPSALRKLGNEGGGLLSSHPNPQDRADRLEGKL